MVQLGTRKRQNKIPLPPEDISDEQLFAYSNSSNGTGQMPSMPSRPTTTRALSDEINGLAACRMGDTVLEALAAPNVFAISPLR